jgi:hypothetical protein
VFLISHHIITSSLNEGDNKGRYTHRSSAMFLSRTLMCLLVALSCPSSAPLPTPARINVCLHAQVSPEEKVVGSVVTTDGE